MELGNFESHRQPRRRRFTKEQMADIRAGRCFVCKRKGCRARNHDKTKRLPPAVVKRTQFEGVEDRTPESSDEELEN